MSKDRDFDKRKKFMMELLGDPVYQPMRFREIAGLLRLSKDEKKDLYRVLDDLVAEGLSLIHISEPTRLHGSSRMPSSA